MVQTVDDPGSVNHATSVAKRTTMYADIVFQIDLTDHYMVAFPHKSFNVDGRMNKNCVG